MILATARLNFKDPALLDITVKSANTEIGKLLAPTWELVKGIKLWQAQNAPADAPVDLSDWFSGAIPLSWEQYTEKYLHLLRVRYLSNRIPFISLLTGERAVLGCYCTDASCCHRTLAAEALVKIGRHSDLPVEFLGELVVQKELI